MSEVYNRRDHFSDVLFVCLFVCFSIESWLTNPFEYKIGLDASGIVWDINPLVYKFPCVANLRNFPYDVQKCKLVLGSLSGGPDRFTFVSNGQIKEINLQDFFMMHCRPMLGIYYK